MKFTKPSANQTPIKDTVFAVSNLAEQDRLENPDKVINATIGSLYDENRNLVAYSTVFNSYDAIEDRKKASYAKSFTGNPEFRELAYHFVTNDVIPELAHSVIATPGGTGAISTSFQAFLEKDETIILPKIAWGSYKLMASMYQNNVVTYDLFDEDHFNFASFEETVLKVAAMQERVVIVLNDPCHNPTGYTLSPGEWTQMIAFLNEVSKTNHVILINDIAYIDYSYDLIHSRDYMKNFANISDQVMVVVCFSCSKTFTSYGLRCGGAILLAKNQVDVREAEIIFEKLARATWSNIPNAAMINFTNVLTNHKEEFLKEKAGYVDLLRKRSEIFLEEAKQARLDCYPYKEGFFITIKAKDENFREAYHQALMEEHIYTVVVNEGIRIAICSLPIDCVKGLAFQLKEIQTRCEKAVK